MTEKMYVVRRDVTTGTVVLAPGEFHPCITSMSLHAKDAIWISGKAPVNTKLEARIRHGVPVTRCEIQIGDDGIISVDFQEPIRAVAPGQVVAFYDGEACIGGATIVSEKCTPKKKKKKKGGKKPSKKKSQVSIGYIDLRVGLVLEAKVHPDPDRLYVEKIDVGG